MTGNLKFDVSLPAPTRDRLDTLRGGSLTFESAGPILVCGSTVEDEEALLLKAFENILVKHPRAVMILAPRHPERFDAVASLMEEMGISWRRRSRWQGERLAGTVLLAGHDWRARLRCMLWQTFKHLWVESLVPRGGHNIIEPAQHGVAVVTGESHRKLPPTLYGSSKAVTPCALSGLAELPLTPCCIFWKNDQERKDLQGVAPKRLFRVRRVLPHTQTLEAIETLFGQTSVIRLPASAHAAHKH